MSYPGAPSPRPLVMHPAYQATKFDAFISYSHSSDPKLAPALRRELQSFAKPWWRRRALRVFQDVSNLETNPDLWSTIHQALLASRALVLLCSPASAASPGVGKEIAAWLAANRELGSPYLRPYRPILLVLTEGEIVWDEARRDFDWNRTTAVPRALSGVFPGEPLWLDLRWARTAATLSVRDPRFRDAIASLAAPLRGKGKDDLIGDDIKQWRRTRRTAWSAVVLLLALTVVAGSSAIYANHQRGVAVEALDRLLQEQRKTVARTMALQALLTRESDPELSLRLSTTSMALAPDESTRWELVTTLLQTHYAGGSAPGVNDELENSTGGTSKVFGRHGDVLLTQVPQRRTPPGQIPTIPPLDEPKKFDLRLWDTTDARHPVVKSVLSGHESTSRRLVGAQFSPDGRLLATADETNILLWDLNDLGAPQLLATIRPGLPINNVAFAPDGRRLAAVGETEGEPGTTHGWLTFWDVTSPARPRQTVTRSEAAGSSAIDFSVDGKLMVTSKASILVNTGTGELVGSSLTLWDVTDPTGPTAYPTKIPLTGGHVAFSPAGGILANTYGFNTELWDVRDPNKPRLLSTLRGHAETVRNIAFSRDGHTLVTTSADNTALVWDVSDPARPTQLAKLSGSPDSVANAVFSADGATLTTVDDHDTVIRWRVRDGQPRNLAIVETTTQVHAMAAIRAGTLLATGDSSGQVRLWDPRTPDSPVGTISGLGGLVGAVAFNADGTILAIGNAEGPSLAKQTSGMVELWDVHDPAKPHRLGSVATKLPVISLAFHPRYPTLSVMVGNPAVYFNEGEWSGVYDVSDPANPSLLAQYPQPGQTKDDRGQPILLSIDQNVYSPDGELLGLGGEWWDVSQPGHATPTDLDASGNVVFSPDGHTIYTSGATLRIYDITDPANARQLSSTNMPRFNIRTLLVYPTGHLLVGVDDGGSLVFIDVSDPAKPLVATTLRVSNYRTALGVLSPDGSWVAAAAVTAREFTVWTLGELPTVAGDALHLACDLAGELTAAQWKATAQGLEPVKVCS